MLAAVYHGLKDVRLEEVDKPKIKSNEVLINVKYCGICGSDIHRYVGETSWTWPTYPVTMGHEFSGEVVEVGDLAPGLEIGDRVVVDPMIGCGACAYCRRGEEKKCLNLMELGAHLDGAFAEYCKAPADHVYKLPTKVSFKEAALCEPTSCCIHTFNLAEITSGTSVAVLGAGPIGLILLQLAKAAGASPLIATDVVSSKLELAKRLGADIALNPKELDVFKEVKDITEGLGVEVCIEAVGKKETYEQAIHLVGMGGRAVLMGFCPQPTTLTLDWYEIMEKQVMIKLARENPSGPERCMTRAISAIQSGQVNAKALITEVFPLEEVIKAFERKLSEPEKTIKIAIKP